MTIFFLLCLTCNIVASFYFKTVPLGKLKPRTTGVPAMCGALMLLTGKWTTKGVHTVEEFDPDPYLDALDKYGLPRSESHAPALVD